MAEPEKPARKQRRLKIGRRQADTFELHLEIPLQYEVDVTIRRGRERGRMVITVQERIDRVSGIGDNM